MAKCFQTVQSHQSTVKRPITSIAAHFKTMKKESDAQERVQGFLKNILGALDMLRELD